MRIDIISCMPDIFQTIFHDGVIGKAIHAGRAQVQIWDLHKFSTNKHHRIDDEPYGGGSGMVICYEPMARALAAIREKNSGQLIYLSPQGEKWSQDLVVTYSGQTEIVLLCGRYRGIDQRFIDAHVDKEISIGDYVCTGGEIPALVLLDSLIRFLPDVLGNTDSLLEESFVDDLLDVPVYTRPEVIDQMNVPEVLLSGDHAKIERWRQEQKLSVTTRKRVDLLKKQEK